MNTNNLKFPIKHQQTNFVLLACSLIVTISTSCGPYWNFYRTYFVDHNAWRNIIFSFAFGIACLGVLGNLIKAKWRLRMLSAQLISFFFLHHITATDGQAWNYLTHVFFSYFLALVSQISKGKLLHEKDAIFGIKFVIAMVYCQSVTSKLVWSGFEWFADGNVIRTYGKLFGTVLGNYLSSKSLLSEVLAITGIILEIFFAFGLFFSRTFLATVCAILLFHFSVFLVFSISFWHLCLIVISLVKFGPVR